MVRFQSARRDSLEARSGAFLVGVDEHGHGAARTRWARTCCDREAQFDASVAALHVHSQVARDVASRVDAELAGELRDRGRRLSLTMDAERLARRRQWRHSLREAERIRRRPRHMLEGRIVQARRGAVARGRRCDADSCWVSTTIGRMAVSNWAPCRSTSSRTLAAQVWLIRYPPGAGRPPLERQRSRSQARLRMRVVIMGCGRVGSTLAARLDREGTRRHRHRYRPLRFRRLPSDFKGEQLVGSGFDHHVLEHGGHRDAPTRSCR